ncbi:hypothetical protein D9M70_592970 [compost metagenome]
MAANTSALRRLASARLLRRIPEDVAALAGFRVSISVVIVSVTSTIAPPIAVRPRMGWKPQMIAM